MPAASKEKTKKQIPLRVSASLYNELAQWAEDDFRSINGQIEFLLTECVKHRKKKNRDIPEKCNTGQNNRISSGRQGKPRKLSEGIFLCKFNQK